MRRSYDLAEAMEVKCFGASKKRTFLKELKMKTMDFVAAMLILIFFGIAIYIRFFCKLAVP